jgi:hypothetical protein
MFKKISIALVGIFAKISASQFITKLVCLAGKEHNPYRKSDIYQINFQNQFIFLEKILSGSQS